MKFQLESRTAAEVWREPRKGAWPYGGCCKIHLGELLVHWQKHEFSFSRLAMLDPRTSFPCGETSTKTGIFQDHGYPSGTNVLDAKLKSLQSHLPISSRSAKILQERGQPCPRVSSPTLAARRTRLSALLWLQLEPRYVFALNSAGGRWRHPPGGGGRHLNFDSKLRYDARHIPGQPSFR